MTSDSPRPPRRELTAAEAAARLGVKRQTLYAYVSRGVLGRTVATDGRTSLFDADEIDRFAQGRRAESDGELRALLTTELTRVDDQGLLIRGHDLVGLVSGGATFTDVVELLWDAPPGERWPAGGDVVWPVPPPDCGLTGALLDELRVIVALASATDPLRHDLSPRSIRSAGRRLITAMAKGLDQGNPEPDSSSPRAPGDGPESVVRRLWQRLAAGPVSDARLRALDGALALLVDHGLAGSTFAARIAASVRADPYSVVSAGLGVLGGTLHGAASGAVHEMLAEAEAGGDPAATVGATRRRLGLFPGFGHSIYQRQDPRYGALMARVVHAWTDDPRLAVVYQVRDLVGQRSDALANVDLALGALTYLAEMPVDAGEVIFAVGRTAGWLAHAQEEYEEAPLRFRARERYAGPTRPAPQRGSQG